jgi:uncharacterized protein GlcG (DUF336 family)
MHVKHLTVVLSLVVIMAGCGGGTFDHPPQTTTETNTLTAADVQSVVRSAASAVADPLVISVVDRAGNVLALYRQPNAPKNATSNFGRPVLANDLAVALARTAAFFSNDQAPLSSRTVRYISGIHFPPGVMNTPNADLYGIENTNRGCGFNTTYLPGKAVPPARALNGGFGLGIITGKKDFMDSDATAVNPGGVPLYKNNQLVGGVGVAGSTPAISEFAALSGVVGANFLPRVPSPGAVVLGGIALPFVLQTTMPAGAAPGAANGSFVITPVASAGPVPDGDLIEEHAGAVGGLTQSEVASIVANAVATANQTRAMIRLPIGQRTRMVIAVADLDGSLLALYRMPDATVFSIDVAVAKARNMAYYNSAQANLADLPGVPSSTAVTNRTISFGAQPFYPPGINGSQPGPFFPLFLLDVQNPCTQGMQPKNANQSGIVFFPGSVGLYRGGFLVGALGVSGDGVDQDDFVTAGGSAGFEAPVGIRADQIIDQGVRLPYQKFPRNPTQ